MEGVVCWVCKDRFVSPGALQGHIQLAHNGAVVLQDVIRPADPSPSQAPGIRPSWDTTWSEVAKVIALRSTCPRKAVGAVLVDYDNHVLSTGYNGAPAGERHCTEVGCDLDEQGHCVRTVHAEMNAILGCTTGMERGIMYVTHFPCPACVLVLVQVGIRRLVCPVPPDKPRYRKAMQVLMHQDVTLTLEKE